MVAKNNPTKQKRPEYVKDLILLFSVPIGVAILAVAFIYGPQLFARPGYDFIYYVCNEYRCKYDYMVDQSGMLSIKEPRQSEPDIRSSNETPTLYYYDVGRDATRAITYEEARHLKIDASSRSPDGYTLTQENSSGSFLLWGRSDSGWYLKNGAASKKIDVDRYGMSYMEQSKFLGWIK